MLSEKNSVIDIKAEVWTLVARYAYEGDLEEKMETIPETIIPGPHAQFRCCIYREREIVRQRVNMMLDKYWKGRTNVVNTIKAACEDCPLSRYTVTDNCRKCVMKACLHACHFGAVSIGDERSHIDPSKCKECGMCAKACPYNAIADLVRPCKNSCPAGAITMDENGLCVIDQDKCINCGKCVNACPFGAIVSRSFIVDVINEINAGKEVYAMIAPAWEGQYGPDVTIASWKEAAKGLGFKDLYDVALGGDLTAASEAEEWEEAFKEQRSMTTSCCPAFVNMIRKHYPKLAENISSTVSPMCALSRMIKAEHPGAVTVFIGPCIAKKGEAFNGDLEGNADYALTLREINAMMRAKGITVSAKPNEVQEASTYGKRFGNSGGVTKAVIECMKEDGFDSKALKICRANGADECKKALMLMQAGKLPEQYIEGMMCDGGCVGGPGAYRGEMKSRKDRDTLIAQADKRGVHENLEKYPTDKFSMSSGKDQ
jgi:[FeFe] hydrogenase (group B1/B3)